MESTVPAKLKEQRPLQPVAAGGWRGGFGNLLRKELGQWWGTRTWWVQIVIWVAILNGISTIVMLTEATPPAETLQEVVGTFLALGAFAIGIGTIITVQGAIVGERELGTAAWVMSKPASRPAFILAKMLSYIVGFWVTGIIIPATIFIISTRNLVPAPLALLTFLPGVALLMLGQLFYLSLTLMLGALFNSRGPIIGIAIAFILSGLLLKGFFPMQIMMLTPWLLPDIGGNLALGMSLPQVWPIPIVAVSSWIVVMTVVSLWRFSREEF